MIIYGAFLIPIIVAIVLYLLFNHKVVWWELVIPLVISVLLIFLSKFIIEDLQTSSTEYLGSLVEKVDYYEPWDEYIHQTCTRTVGSGKNSYTESYDCSYIDSHPERFLVTSTTGSVVQINRSQYLELKTLFRNSTFTDLHRDYYSKDGDKYTSTWDNSIQNSRSFTEEHSYENRIKAADQSIFHYEKVDTSIIRNYQLKNYPSITEGYRMKSILVDNKDIPYKDSLLFLDNYLNYFNGILGKKKQVHIFIILFRNQPIEASFHQESYWSGGNKNELVVCINLDSNDQVKWCKVFSWTKSEQLKSDIKSLIESQSKLNLLESIKSIATLVESQFVRREFKEFSYLTVEPPVWSIVLVYFLVIVVNFLLGYWIVRNEYSN